MATSGGSVFWPGIDEDIEIAPSILKDLFRYLRDNLSIDNNLASELFGWKPLLLGSREHKRIRALNDQGKDDDAFQTWFTFATSAYTKENLVELCKCLRKAGKDAGQEKIICIAEKIEAAMESYRSGKSAGTEENKIMAGSNPGRKRSPEQSTGSAKRTQPGKWSLADRCLFMSHSSKDKDTVDEIVQALRQSGINVWYDKDEIRTGHQWDTKISEDMQHMYGFICCMSEDFFDSEICKRELQAFMSAQKDNSAIPKDSIFPVIVVDPSLFKGVRVKWRMALPTQIHYKKWTVDTDQQLFLKDMKDFVNGSTPTPSTSPAGPQSTTGSTPTTSTNPPAPQPTTDSSSSTGTTSVSSSTGSHTTIHGGVHYNICSVTDSSMSPGSHHHSTAGITQAGSDNRSGLSTSGKRSPNQDTDRQTQKRTQFSNVSVDNVIQIMTREKLTEGVKKMLTDHCTHILCDDQHLINDDCRHRILALLANGHKIDAANQLIDYFRNNHDGSSLDKFCEFLTCQAHQAGSSANMTKLSEEIRKAMESALQR